MAAPDGFVKLLRAAWSPATIDQPLPEELLEGTAAPERFLSEMFRYRESESRRVTKSRYPNYYDFYHDLISSQLGLKQTALSCYLGDGRWSISSYDDLHQESSAVVGKWATLGVEVGMSVGIALPMGKRFAVALLAALRLGLTIVPIGQVGSLILRRHVEATKPDFLVCNALDLQDAGLEAAVVLPAHAEATTSAHLLNPSPPYGRDDIVLRMISPLAAIDCAAGAPLGKKASKPVEVRAEDLYVGLLRDSVVLYGLRPQEAIAQPGFVEGQHGLHTMLTAFLAGANYVQFSVKDLVERPQLCADLPVAVLGISPELLPHISAKLLGGFSDCRLWFRSLTHPQDPEIWEQKIAVLEKKGIVGINVASSTAFGGAFLYSRRMLRPGLEALPVPGRAFELLEPNGSGEPSLTDSGVYFPAGLEDHRATGQLMLGRRQGSYLYGGCVSQYHRGTAFPCVELEDVAKQHPSVREAVTLTLPTAAANTCHVVLLVFVDPLLEGEVSSRVKQWEAELERLVSVGVGKDRLPDRWEFYALAAPTTEDGELDRLLCADDYGSGALRRKSADRLFVKLAQLRRIFDMLKPSA